MLLENRLIGPGIQKTVTDPITARPASARTAMTGR